MANDEVRKIINTGGVVLTIVLIDKALVGSLTDKSLHTL